MSYVPSAAFKREEDFSNTVTEWYNSFSWARKIVHSPCKCYAYQEGDDLIEIVIHLNDEHDDCRKWDMHRGRWTEAWTRDKIADWLDSLDIDLGIK